MKEIRRWDYLSVQGSVRKLDCCDLIFNDDVTVSSSPPSISFMSGREESVQ
jgi:hypothetical protein